MWFLLLQGKHSRFAKASLEMVPFNLQVFMHYPFERQVEAAVKANPFATRTFGMLFASS